MDRPRLLYFLACHNFVCLPVLWIDRLSPSSQRHTSRTDCGAIFRRRHGAQAQNSATATWRSRPSALAALPDGWHAVVAGAGARVVAAPDLLIVQRGPSVS